ncbi:hypothetical protein D5086_002679 [Populus alba]|uniref:Uncharacterized protein n=1 Tax=Populus alba TaxID=43335 RepID=A0ACC4D2Z8_POPAL
MLLMAIGKVVYCFTYLHKIGSDHMEWRCRSWMFARKGFDSLDKGSLYSTAPAMQVDQYMHRILVEEDANNFNESNGELFHTASEVGEKLYRRGDFAESRIANFDGYLLKEVKFFREYLLFGCKNFCGLAVVDNRDDQIISLEGLERSLS